VGQSLTLQCNGTIVRGITSRVDIVWRDGDSEFRRIDNVSSTTMGNSLVYTDSYTISQLSTTDDDRMIWCEVMINPNSPVMANNTITLDVRGMYMILFNYLYDVILLYTQFLLLWSPYHQLVPLENK